MKAQVVQSINIADFDKLLNEGLERLNAYDVVDVKFSTHAFVNKIKLERDFLRQKHIVLFPSISFYDEMGGII